MHYRNCFREMLHVQFLLHNGFSESQLPEDILISRGYFLGDDIEEEMLREQKISWEEPLPRSTESLLCQLPCKSTCLWAGTLYFHSQLSQVFFGTLQSIEIQKSGIFLLKWQLFAALFETTELRASSAPWHGCAWGGGEIFTHLFLVYVLLVYYAIRAADPRNTWQSINRCIQSAHGQKGEKNELMWIYKGTSPQV